MPGLWGTLEWKCNPVKEKEITNESIAQRTGVVNRGSQTANLSGGKTFSTPPPSRAALFSRPYNAVDVNSAGYLTLGGTFVSLTKLPESILSNPNWWQFFFSRDRRMYEAKQNRSAHFV